MHGYDASTYGEAFADVYDDWYATLTDTDATVGTLLGLVGEGPVLELGVGTGRIAIPLARRSGRRVVGADASPAMLARLAVAVESAGVPVDGVLARMDGDELPAGPFSLVFVAYNTFFGLLDEAAQRSCLAAVRSRLRPGGRFVIEAFVPDDPPRDGPLVELRSMTVDRVVLSVSVHDAAHQRAEGHFVELTETGGVRLRPWAIRYSSPAQLDEMAAAAGLELESRTAGWNGEPFDDDSPSHVTVLRRPTS